jgi:hypothetical protein
VYVCVCVCVCVCVYIYIYKKIKLYYKRPYVLRYLCTIIREL